jgi:hypothetical protein
MEQIDSVIDDDDVLTSISYFGTDTVPLFLVFIQAVALFWICCVDC